MKITATIALYIMIISALYVTLETYKSLSVCLKMNSYNLLFSLRRNDLYNIPYLKLCIQEAMRLYSPVPIICRSSDKSYDLQGRTFPKGKPESLSLYRFALLVDREMNKGSDGDDRG